MTVVESEQRIHEFPEHGFAFEVPPGWQLHRTEPHLRSKRWRAKLEVSALSVPGAFLLSQAHTIRDRVEENGGRVVDEVLGPEVLPSYWLGDVHFRRSGRLLRSFYLLRALDRVVLVRLDASTPKIGAGLIQELIDFSEGIRWLPNDKQQPRIDERWLQHRFPTGWSKLMGYSFGAPGGGSITLMPPKNPRPADPEEVGSKLVELTELMEDSPHGERLKRKTRKTTIRELPVVREQMRLDLGGGEIGFSVATHFLSSDGLYSVQAVLPGCAEDGRELVEEYELIVHRVELAETRGKRPERGDVELPRQLEALARTVERAARAVPPEEPIKAFTSEEAALLTARSERPVAGVSRLRPAAARGPGSDAAAAKAAPGEVRDRLDRWVRVTEPAESEPAADTEPEEAAVESNPRLGRYVRGTDVAAGQEKEGE